MDSKKKELINNNLINKSLDKSIEIINGIQLQIPSFKEQLQQLNLKCQYITSNIPKLLSIVNEKQMNEIKIFNTNRLKQNLKDKNLENVK